MLLSLASSAGRIHALHVVVRFYFGANGGVRQKARPF